ncbi:MAG: type I restriction-modification system subunit M [Spirochaetales bacterium]|nr:type I restriction-modification system subunit M [Spirochaetales bacterium]
MNKQQLASKIWESANSMRGKIEANEYKDYILGFIFYKFLSDKEVAFLKRNDWTVDDLPELKESDDETVKFCQDRIGYFISYDNLFSSWINPSNTAFSAAAVRDALSAFDRLIGQAHKKVFDKIFETLQTGLSKLGDTEANRTKAIRDLLDIIRDIPMDNSQDYDVLGYIYEYLIGNFAANAGKKAGEFYTPHEVALVMADIVAHHHKDKETLSIYDPTSGSASLLLNIGRAVSKHSDKKDNIKYYAQELIATTYNLTRMNLVMRGILPGNIITRNADTLDRDWPFFDEENNYNPLFVDAVVANPPYSQKWDPSNKETDPRFEEYGLAPKGKADYAFLLHNLYHTNDNGIMTIVLPHGVLFRGGEEGTIRKNLIENNKIDAIIGLPANIFFGTGIPTIIMVLRKNRPNTDVLIIDASKGFVKEGKQNKLRASDIKRITDTYIERADVDKYSRKVSRDEIRANDYNLNIPRYVDSSEKPETFDIYATMFGGIPESELAELDEYWKAFPGLKDQLFEKRSDGCYSLKTQELNVTIESNCDVSVMQEDFAKRFEGFDDYLVEELISNAGTVSVNKEEHILGEELFRRLNGVSLIDKYDAYQLLDDQWKSISADLEIIQSEGLDAVKVVEPNMVTVKKDSKIIEKQEGWKGRILPFEYVQSMYLKEELSEIAEKENESSSKQAFIAETLEELSEEDKETIKDNCLNEECDAFNAAGIASYVKSITKKGTKYSPDSLDGRLIEVDKAFKEDKEIKKKLKTLTQELEDKTINFIKNQSDDDVEKHLSDKWVSGLCSRIESMPSVMVKELEDKIKRMSEKYSVTYSDIEAQIADSSSALALMIDELCGSDSDMAGLKEFQKSLKD